MPQASQAGGIVLPITCKGSPEKHSGVRVKKNRHGGHTRETEPRDSTERPPAKENECSIDFYSLRAALLYPKHVAI